MTATAPAGGLAGAVTSATTPAIATIAGVGSAFPHHYYDQETLLAALRGYWEQRYFNLDRIEQLHKNVLVGGRHLALPIEEYPGLTTFGQSNSAWIRVAEEIGGEAVVDAIGQRELHVEVRRGQRIAHRRGQRDRGLGGAGGNRDRRLGAGADRGLAPARRAGGQRPTALAKYCRGAARGAA